MVTEMPLQSSIQEHYINKYMSKKKSFVLRIGEEDYKALKKWADDEFRSVNGHLEWLIRQALIRRGKDSSEKNKDVE